MLSSSHTPKDPPEITLTFLGSGHQFYVFETPDPAYVIKFVKFSRRTPLPWLEKLPLPSPLSTWRNIYLAKRANRLAHLQQSAALALQRIPLQTGLLPTPSLPPSITLIDKLGILHNINPSHTLFFLQQKATPFTDYFNAHPSESLIDSYIQTIVSQCRKGLCNLDPLTERNYGVVNERVIILDIGSFLPHSKLNTPIGLKRQIFLELLPLREWLQKHHPQHLPYFDACLKKTIENML